MVKASDLTKKEVINITDGRKLGFIADLKLDLDKGKINAIIVPNTEKILGIFGKDHDNEITWGEIKKIGVDFILVEIKGTGESIRYGYISNKSNPAGNDYMEGNSANID